MCEVDERRIKELAKLPPRVLGGARGLAARQEARRVVERLALMHGDVQHPRDRKDSEG